MAWNPLRILGLLLTFGSMALFLGCPESPKAEKAKSSLSQPAAKSATRTAASEPETSLAKSDEVEKRSDRGRERRKNDIETFQAQNASPAPYNP